MSTLTVPPDVIGTPLADLIQGVSDSSSNYFTTIGIEILGGIIDSSAGDDTISGTGESSYTGIGISNSGTINAGTGNDTITGTGESGEIYRSRIPGLGIINSGTMSAGTGDDSITGIGMNGGPGIFNTNRGWISGDAGNDAITGIGGISNGGSIDGGTGDDSISGTDTGLVNAYGPGEAGVGISNTDWIGGGQGNDFIIGTGMGGRGGVYIGPGPAQGGNGTGISNSDTISGGTGDDVITGIGKGGMDTEFVSAGGNGVGISNSSYIRGDNGNDTLTGIGIGGRGNSAPDGRGVGIFNTGRLEAGNGEDEILGYGTTVGIEGNGVESIGIDGGNGNDYFKARKVDGFDTQENLIESANQDGAIANIFISGGKGNDIFDVGFGSAMLDGGKGCDTLILPTLGSGSYIIGSPNADGLFQITNTASLNVLSVSNIEHIFSGGVALV